MSRSFFKRRYDLPLHKKEGTGFILWVIALMTFLCTMTLAGSFFLTAMTHSWEEGLKGQMTIEVKAQIKDDGQTVTTDYALQHELQNAVLDMLARRYPTITANAIPEAEILTMVAPWFGMGTDDSTLADQLPIPSLITLTLSDDIDANDTAFDRAALERDLKAISTDIHLDTHEKWLADMVRLTHKIRNVGYLLAIVIGFTTFVAVAGAARSRLSMHFNDIELLHLIGANDNYIAGQFARHATLITLEGACVGGIMALGALVGLTEFTPADQTALIPTLNLDAHHWAILISLPILSAIIAFMTSRVTTLRFLKRLP